MYAQPVYWAFGSHASETNAHNKFAPKLNVNAWFSPTEMGTFGKPLLFSTIDAIDLEKFARVIHLALLLADKTSVGSAPHTSPPEYHGYTRWHASRRSSETTNDVPFLQTMFEMLVDEMPPQSYNEVHLE